MLSHEAFKHPAPKKQDMPFFLTSEGLTLKDKKNATVLGSGTLKTNIVCV